MVADYGRVKSKLLEVLGDTPEEAARRWWVASKSADESYDAYTTRLLTMNNRRLADIKDVEKLKANIVLSRFMYSLPPACATFVSS